MKRESRSGNLHALVVDLVENAGRGVKNFLIHLTIRSDGFGQRDGNNLVPAQRRHLPEFAAVHHVDGTQSVARGQYAVESAGRSAPLDVAENNRARLEASPLFDFLRQYRADSAQAGMPEFIQACCRLSLVAPRKLRAFGCHHDAEVSSAGVALANSF